MKCVFIDIGYDCEELNEPLGIEVLMSYLNYHLPDIETSMLFSNIDGDDYCEYLLVENPDIIAVSTHINTWQRLNIFYQSYVRFSKKSNRHPVLIVGGVIATYEYKQLLSFYPNVICSIGEGEETILSICSIYKDNIEYSLFVEKLEELNCPNLAFYRNNRLVVTNRSVIKELIVENIPNKHLYLNKVINKGGLARIEASRGCPWNNCSFCVLNWKYNGRKWRPFSLEKVLTEIIQLSNLGTKIIYFTDEEFIAGDYLRLQKFIDIIKVYKNNKIINPELEFVASTSVRSILGNKEKGNDNPKDVLLQMREIGFRSFFVGIESGSETQLRRFCKGCTVSEIEEVLGLFRECQIEPDIGYIIFDPLMNIGELIENLYFLKRNNLHRQISRFAKRLRIIPSIRYCQFPELQLVSFDKEQVEYSYFFKDKKIIYIYNVYSEWELYNIKRTHTLQAQIRAASTSSEKRNDLKQKLISIREKEFEVLMYLTETAKHISDVCLEKVAYKEKAKEIEEMIEENIL